MSAIITTQSLTKSVLTPYPLTILNSVTLKINANESVAIQGASGSGKTTLLGILAGLDIPSSGEVWFGEHPLHQMNEDQRAKIRLNHIGFVFQNFDLLPHFTALENVMLALQLKRVAKARVRAMALLEKVGLRDRVSHYPRQLSGGEQQRVAIARAFATEPDVLFADEPTGSLDSHTGESIMSLLFSLNQEMGTTLVFVTHDQDLAERCQQQFHLQSGQLV